MLKEQIKYPHSDDIMWNQECESIIPYLFGYGVDIGCSNRSIYAVDARVDIDEKHNPDYCGSGDDLPFRDEEFDYLYSIHSFEHFDDQIAVLDEWSRVVKKGGIIAIVHPDVDYTHVQKSEAANPDKNPYNKHYHERNQKEFISWFESLKRDDLKVIDHGEACPNWSFFVVFKKV